MSAPPSIKERYLARLGLEESQLLPLNYDTLCLITEANLEKIPFGNLSQHGAKYAANLTTDGGTATKLLDSEREGFCYEVNLLLASFLMELGFKVQLFDAQVFTPDFWTPPVHVWLLVETPDDERTWFVDVGNGEPALHLLEYVMDKEQETAEGMQSRFVKRTESEADDVVVLEWMKGGEWTPRLKWSADLAQPKDKQDFQPNLEMVLTDKLPFANKYVVVKLTRHEKVSIVGNKLKRTSPRFGPDNGGAAEQRNEPTILEMESIEIVRKKLEEEFGIPFVQTDGLDWSKSLQAPPHLWDEF
jgi:N-hydroxyarylamine O-acetyltransferase